MSNNGARLYYAVKYGHMCGMKALLNSGVDPETKIFGNQTSLDFACSNCFRWNHVQTTEFVSLLVQYKASMETADKCGKTPLLNAIEAGNDTFIETLLDCKAMATSDALFEAVVANDAKTTEMLLGAGATVDLKTLELIGSFLDRNLSSDIMCLKHRKFHGTTPKIPFLEPTISKSREVRDRSDLNNLRCNSVR